MMITLELYTLLPIGIMRPCVLACMAACVVRACVRCARATLLLAWPFPEPSDIRNYQYANAANQLLSLPLSILAARLSGMRCLQISSNEHEDHVRFTDTV